MRPRISRAITGSVVCFLRSPRAAIFPPSMPAGVVDTPLQGIVPQRPRPAGSAVRLGCRTAPEFNCCIVVSHFASSFPFCGHAVLNNVRFPRLLTAVYFSHLGRFDDPDYLLLNIFGQVGPRRDDGRQVGGNCVVSCADCAGFRAARFRNPRIFRGFLGLFWSAWPTCFQRQHCRGSPGFSFALPSPCPPRMRTADLH